MQTTNWYSVEKSDYHEHLHKSVTNDYKLANKDFIHQCSMKDKEITDKLEISERVYSASLGSAFVTVKDHKPNFINNIQWRLLNHAKTNVGKISKQKLAKVVAVVKQKSGLNQWKNSDSVIDWFKNLQGKKKMSFIQFDICNFYPSITPTLLQNGIDLVSNKKEMADLIKNYYMKNRRYIGNYSTNSV